MHGQKDYYNSNFKIQVTLKLYKEYFCAFPVFWFICQGVFMLTYFTTKMFTLF